MKGKRRKKWVHLSCNYHYYPDICSRPKSSTKAPALAGKIIVKLPVYPSSPSPSISGLQAPTALVREPLGDISVTSNLSDTTSLKRKDTQNQLDPPHTAKRSKLTVEAVTETAEASNGRGEEAPNSTPDEDEKGRNNSWTDDELTVLFTFLFGPENGGNYALYQQSKPRSLEAVRVSLLVHTFSVLPLVIHSRRYVLF